MPTYDADVATGWAPEDAFAYLAERSRAAEWDPGVVRTECLDAGPGFRRVGDRGIAGLRRARGASDPGRDAGGLW